VQVPYQNLDKVQKEALDRLMNSPSAGLTALGSAFHVRESTSTGYLLREDIQLSVPGRLPPATPITIRLGAVPTIYGYSYQAPTDGVYEVSPSALAHARANNQGALSTIDRFLAQNMEFLQVIADFGKDGRFARATYPPDAPKPSNKWLTMKEMPAEFQEAFNKSYQEALDKKNRGGG
jgi:hypothetical protein